jgi:hypothetical protein
MRYGNKTHVVVPNERREDVVIAVVLRSGAHRVGATIAALGDLRPMSCQWMRPLRESRVNTYLRLASGRRAPRRVRLADDGGGDEALVRVRVRVRDVPGVLRERVLGTPKLVLKSSEENDQDARSTRSRFRAS